MTVVSGAVYAPPTASIADGSNTQAIMQGKSGEMVDAKLHGDWYTPNYRGRLFFVSTATAGITIPVQASGLVSTFCLLNPVGSGVNMELISLIAAFEAATTVVSDVSVYFQTQIGSVNAALASTTALTPRPAFLGGTTVTAQMQAFSAATFTGALTKGPTLFGAQAVTSTNTLPIEYSFNGRLLLAPGTAIALAGNAAQTSATQITTYWAEWPL